MTIHTHIVQQEEGQTERTVQMRASDPGTPADNQLWINTTQKQLKTQIAGVLVAIGGGGGGAGFRWRELGGNSALASTENSEDVYLFTQSDQQELYASLKVPQSYVAGTQIILYISAYSAGTSGTILLLTQSTLIRKGTDAFTSTTNQRTSTNTALTNTVANQLREFVCDLTDSVGKINSVAVGAGDVIKVRLYRDTSGTDTNELRMVPNSTDIKFA